MTPRFTPRAELPEDLDRSKASVWVESPNRPGAAVRLGGQFFVWPDGEGGGEVWWQRKKNGPYEGSVYQVRDFHEPNFMKVES